MESTSRQKLQNVEDECYKYVAIYLVFQPVDNEMDSRRLRLSLDWRRTHKYRLVLVRGDFVGPAISTIDNI